MNWLKQSTAVTLKLGPFLDSTDGDTEETALTIAYTDVMLSKNGGTIGAKSDTTGATHDADGWYSVPLNTTDTGTLGRLKVYIHVSGALAVWEEYLVVPANVYDSLVLGTDYLQGDTIQIEGSDATDQINAACDTAISDAALATAANLQTVDGIVDEILSLLDDARPEPGQGAPPVNADAMTKLDYLYKALRNKKTQTATTFNLYNDAGDTIDQTSSVSDDGTTATVGELTSGA